MSHDAIILVALGVPVLAMVLLRVNGAMVFLSLCLGAVLVQYVAGQANDLLHLVAPHAGTYSKSTIQLALLLGPAVATAVLTILSVHGRMKALVNLIPSAGAAALAVLLAAPLMPEKLKHSFGAPAAWQVLSKSQALVVGVGAVLSLMFLWSQRGNFRHEDKRKR